MEQTDFQRQVKFILRFGKALHAAGSPAHTLEATMQEMCQNMCIKGTFISQPTGIFSSFSNGEEEITKIERVEPMGVNLGRLAKIDLISQEVIQHQISYEEGHQKLDDVLDEPEPFGKRIHITHFLFSAAGFLVLFGGTWGDMLAALIVGIIMGIIYIFRPVGPVVQMFEAMLAIVAAFGTYLLAKVIPGLNVGVIILSCLIIFMPGIFITLAIAEIATQNLVSGTARMVGGVMILLKLTFGVFIGSKIASWFHIAPIDITFGIIPTWVAYFTLPITALMSVVGFKVNREDWKWVTIAGIYGYFCAKLGTHFLGAELGMFFGGACVGVMSNIFARFKNKPSSIFQFPGIILLVPGSVGYRSMNFLFERDVLGGLDTAFTMIALAMALVVGLFFGNLLIKPRRSL
jgi:uncharacterized membrane protein YjjP (DUF1212 family)